MANEKWILYEKEGQIAKVILNRPEKLNALAFEMYDDMVTAIKKAEEDDDVKVIILKANGRAFSVGYDLTKVGFVYGITEPKPGEPPPKRASQRSRLKFDRHILENVQHVMMCWKPIIAQVHGYCIGGGLYTAEACDITICSEDAQMGHAEQRLGFAGATFTLPLEMFLIGPKKARELLLTGKLISGTEAEKIGLVNKAVPVDKLEEEVMTMAKAICLLPRDGIIIGKSYTHMVYDSLGLTGQWISGYLGHTLFTNIRWESDEYNFFKERMQKGAKSGFHGRDDRYKGVGM